jgi:hypothetical protein
MSVLPPPPPPPALHWNVHCTVYSRLCILAACIYSYPTTTLAPAGVRAEVGKVTLGSNDDEVLSDESLLKSNGNESLNGDFP